MGYIEYVSWAVILTVGCLSPESWPMRGEDVAFADSAPTGQDPTDLVVAGGRPLSSGCEVGKRSILIPYGHDLGHCISDMYHRSAWSSNCKDHSRGHISDTSHDLIGGQEEGVIRRFPAPSTWNQIHSHIARATALGF